MDKLKMHSKDKTQENFEILQRLFPNAVTETITGYDEDGKAIVERAIDKDVLQQEINATVVDGREERYQFTWPDKKRAIVSANAPINKTLRPCREESVDFDNTENLYIEGDNLEVLKLLQETYLGKIKMIYIDPPYNTGKDFVYSDKYSISPDEWDEMSGELDEYGNRLVQNNESNGRFHTDWLNMIYPRLKIARDLLTDDGVIFISIDDNEVENLKKICDEILGRSNFISEIVWQNKKGGGNDSTYIAIEHEYVLVYGKDKNSLGEFYEKYSKEYIKRYKEEDEIGRFYWDTFKRKAGKQYYPIKCPDGTILENDEDGNPISWLRSEPRFKDDLRKGEIRFVKTTSGWSVQFKQRIPLGKTPRSIFSTNTVIDDKGTTSSGSNDTYGYFKKDVFSNPKPVSLIEFFIGFGLEQNDIIMDFFSGSATTADAVFRAGLDGNNYKFILVQIPESIDKMLNSSSANAKRVAKNAIEVLDELGKEHTITELAKERIVRAGKEIKSLASRNTLLECGLDLLQNQNNLEVTADIDEKLSIYNELDIGFRVLKLDESNMKDIYYNPADFQKSLLDTTIDNIKEDRTPEDLLFQVMLDLGVLLSEKIEENEIAGKKVFNVANGYLVACFDSDVNEAVITAVAKQKPIYFVMRDSSMATDTTATNFDQIFETYSPDTVRKVI